jgi:tetratricopeptide (TPR) repeat protein
MEISFDHGGAALLNGFVSFVIAVVVAGFFWLIYQLMRLVRLNHFVGWIFGRVDVFLRKILIHLTGASLETPWRRWGVFTLHFLILAAIGAFAPLTVALIAIGVALVSVLAIYRYWERDEDKRIERIAEGRSNYEGQDLRDEMFAAIGLLLFFIPLGYVRINEASAVLAGHSAYPSIDAALFVWGELTKALPLVDWSEIFRVRNLSGVEASGAVGLSLNFFIRILFDLLVLAGILRTLDILRSQSRGDDLRAEEEALRSEDPAKVEAALDRIIEVALLGRRHAISHLFEITQASRTDGRLVEPRWREKSARALADVAEALLESSVDLTDLDKRLLAIEALKASGKFTREIDPLYWAETLINLGNALSSIGRIAGDTARLEEAVTAYRAALEVRTRDVMPASWAATQNNLGVALRVLGEIAGDTARLEEAVTAFRAALEVRTRDAMPANWAGTQTNLGNVLSSIGLIAGDTARLEEAVTAFRAALEVYSRDVMPTNWVMTQNGLGLALGDLGEIAGDTARLEEAVAAYRAALEVATRDAMPSNWAMTQNNLGIALQALGQIEGDTAHLEEAVTAYRAALEVNTRDAMPAAWAGTQTNLGNALGGLGKIAGDAARMEEAVTAYRAALEVNTRDAMPADWAMTQNNLGGALQVLGQIMGDTAHLEKAVTAYRAALEVNTRDAMPADWAGTQNNLGGALWTLGEIAGDTARLEEAIEVFEALVDFYDAKGDEDKAQACRTKIEEIRALLGG